MVFPQLNRLLRVDERVLWSGKPVKVPFILPSLASIPFGLFFLSFSVFWMWGAVSMGAPWPFSLFGVPFVLIAFGITFGTPIWQLMRYNNTEYMITDQRIITQTGAIGLDTRFVELDKIQEVYVKIGLIDRKFGTGTVYVTTASYVYVGGSGGSMRPGLASLKEPYEVQKILQDAIERARMIRAAR